MDRLDRHVEYLVDLKTDRERKLYLLQHGDLRCNEGARILCRSAVALLYSDVDRAETLCRALTILARMLADELSAGYRDHAWAALYFSNGADYKKAFLRWKRALAHFEAAGRHDEAAITCSCGLGTLAYVNRLDLFRQWEGRARTFFERNGDRLRLGRLRSNAATLHAQRDEWKLAAQAYELAYHDLVVAGAGNSDIWVLLSNLTICYILLGDLPRAAQLLEKARSTGEDADLHTSVARLGESMAYIRYLRGDFASALAIVRGTREYSSHHGLRHYSNLSALTEAEILHALCSPREAEDRASEALETFERLGVKSDQGKALMILGHCARTRGRHGRALELYAQARQLFDDCGSLPRAQQAAIHEATVIFEGGDHEVGASLARGLLESAPSDPANATGLRCRLLLSRILLERGELREALLLAETALTQVSFLDRAPLEAEALHLFARVHERSGDLQRAYDAYLQCERCIDRIRRQLAPGELKTSFLSDKTDLYEDLFVVGLQLGFEAGQVFEFAEKAKSRTLAELLARQLQSPWGARDAKSEDLLDLWSSLRASVKQIEELGLSGEPNAARRIEELRQRVTAAESATLRLMADRGATGVFSARREAPPTAGQVASMLPEQTALVEFYFARGRIFALLIAEGTCEALPLGEIRPVERLHRLVMFHLRTRPSLGLNGEIHRSSLMDHLRRLYDLLWSPLRPCIDATSLVIVPHGFLHHLPLHALFDGHQFLADRHTITYSPSAGVYHATRSRPRDSDGFGSLVIGSSDDNSPEISAEARDVAEMLPDARVFLDGRAIKAHLLPELPQASLIHIAAHGSFLPADPSASALRLGDGQLTVKELQELHLQADLVVLSGCETGRSATKGSDEIVGLTQALLQAGARSALVSLWNVDDHSTAEFMRGFYSELRLASSRGAALRNAQLAHREIHSHPYFWAPFILVGDPEVSEKEAATAIRWTEREQARTAPATS